MNSNKIVHKLIVKPLSAITACGLKICCAYPASSQALLFDSDDKIDYSENNSKVTCLKCKVVLKY